MLVCAYTRGTRTGGKGEAGGKLIRDTEFCGLCVIAIPLIEPLDDIHPEPEKVFCRQPGFPLVGLGKQENPMAQQTPRLSLIVPVLNEEDAIEFFLNAIRPVLAEIGLTYEVIFIDDGSTDNTAQVIETQAAQDPCICLLRLTRNFGKEAALTAGLDWSRGDAIIPMDVDLQDPPELIGQFVTHWQAGYDIAYGQRIDRSTDSALKRVSAKAFYRVFNRLTRDRIEDNAGDFRLMDRRVVEATLHLRERNRFMKGLFAWVGFKAIAVPYSRPERIAGDSKFSFWRLWNFALDGITSFSTVPLRIWTYLGMVVAGAAFTYMLFLILRTLVFGSDVPGYASLMVVVLLLGAVQLISLGVIGEYLGRLYIEVKQRPIYLVQQSVGIEPKKTHADAPVETVIAFPETVKETKSS